jgi:hypothetical protein
MILISNFLKTIIFEPWAITQDNTLFEVHLAIDETKKLQGYSKTIQDEQKLLSQSPYLTLAQLQ